MINHSFFSESSQLKWLNNQGQDLTSADTSPAKSSISNVDGLIATLTKWRIAAVIDKQSQTNDTLNNNYDGLFWASNTPTTFVSSASMLEVYDFSQAVTTADNLKESVKTSLKNVYFLDALHKNRAAAREMMIFTEDCIKHNGLASCNQLLNEADVTRLSSRSMIGLVRSTYRIKENLPAWNKTYEASWRQLKKTGKRPEALFVGLPVPKGTKSAEETW